MTVRSFATGVDFTSGITSGTDLTGTDARAVWEASTDCCCDVELRGVSSGSDKDRVVRAASCSSSGLTTPATLVSRAENARLSARKVNVLPAAALMAVSLICGIVEDAEL